MKQQNLNEGLRAAIKAAGGIRKLARLLGITYQAILHWDKVPAERMLEIEDATGISRDRLRPDLYRPTDGPYDGFARTERYENGLTRDEVGDAP
jgi:DNA-binding transcriptional regulator YdaS (Cro superfamily)